MPVRAAKSAAFHVPPLRVLMGRAGVPHGARRTGGTTRYRAHCGASRAFLRASRAFYERMTVGCGLHLGELSAVESTSGDGAA